MAGPVVDRLTRAARLGRLVSVPPLAVAIGWLAVLAVTGITGRHPIWSVEARNLAEAIAFGDRAAVVRMIGYATDPNRAGEVRGGIVFPDTAVLTPIEAAAATGQRDMMLFLLNLGASLDPAVWQRAWCMSDEPEVRELLDAHRPPGARDECVER